MKPFFTVLCVLCFTTVFALAEEPELIERPLSWTIDSIQIVWNVAEQQLENYEWRATSNQGKSSSVGNSQLSQGTHTNNDTSWDKASVGIEAKVSGGAGFSPKFFANWGLEGSASLQAGLGRKREDSLENIQQNEWVKSVKNTSQITETEDASESSQTLKSGRKLLFTVNFVNHTDDDLIFDQSDNDTIPIYCGNKQLGYATPVNKGEFRIPHHTGIPKPCQFQMPLNDSSKMKLLESAPDIRILGSQIRIYNDECNDALTQSIQKFPSFTVRLTADNASREWKFKYYKKHKYALNDVFEAINEDCEEEELFEFNEDGSILSVAGYPVKPVKDGKAFVLFAWNGEPVTDFKDLKLRKNSILDVILVSRTLLESRQNDPFIALVPFKETLEKWAKDGLFDGKNLAMNLLTDKGQRIVEIKRLNYKLKNIKVPDDIATIEEACSLVEDNGTITIQPGKYELSKTLEVDRNVTFLGSTGKAEDVVIDCLTSDAFLIAGDSPSFQNLTVSSGAEKCRGFYVRGGTPKLFRCSIVSGKGSGMYVDGEKADPKVESCVIKDCGGCGVVVQEKGLGTFNDCEIYGNAKSGIQVTTSGNPTVTGCKIHNGKQAGVFVNENGLGTFHDCEIYGNAKSGIQVTTSGNPTVTKCKIHDGKTNGIHINEKGLGKFNDCDIYGDEIGEILVHKSGNVIFSDCKIHDGKGFGIGIGNESLGNFYECEIYRNVKPGIMIDMSGNPTFTTCKISDGKDCGVVVSKKGLGEFKDCEICGNSLAGIIVETSGNPTITGCKIHGNRACGVLVYDGGKGTFINNTLSENYYEGELDNWGIDSDAGEVKGSGNIPEIPSH